MTTTRNHHSGRIIASFTQAKPVRGEAERDPFPRRKCAYCDGRGERFTTFGARIFGTCPVCGRNGERSDERA